MTINVYLVDDSAVMRQAVAHLLAGDGDIRLQGSAPNTQIAAAAIRRSRPDVLLLDIEMPGQDGLSFLREILPEQRIPTVVCSTLVESGSRSALEALAAGAVAVIAKPKLAVREFVEGSRKVLCDAIRVAARANVQGRPPSQPPVRAAPRPVEAPLAGGRLQPAGPSLPVLIGSSTGGTQAIETVLSALPADCPGIAIVQHMPERFTQLYAQRLDASCAMHVREARDGDRLERGVVLVAPGAMHMRLARAPQGGWRVAVADGPPVNRHKPSVDVLFRSACESAGHEAMAIMLTGMGADGARGMKALHDAGALTIAQSERTCVVYGMPKEAVELGAVTRILDLEDMAGAILAFDREHMPAGRQGVWAKAP